MLHRLHSSPPAVPEAPGAAFTERISEDLLFPPYLPPLDLHRPVPGTLWLTFTLLGSLRSTAAVAILLTS